MRFTYTGTRSGTFQTSGRVSLSPEGRPRHGTWAAALKVPGSDLSIAAARAGTPPLADVFLIALHNIDTPGTYSLKRTCDHHTPTSCALGLFAFDYNWNTSDQTPESQYLLASGTITITQMDGSHLKGSFQVDGLTPSGGSVKLANGSFDVPVVHANSVRQNFAPLWSVLGAVEARGTR